MSYTVLARRYRSRTFDELVGQEPIARTLRNAVDTQRTAHAYLFCGTRGVGKTSMARIFARALNVTDALQQADAIADAILRGDDLDVIEIDGASNRGIQEAKELIAGAGLSPARCRFKVYIIDEVHMLTREAFNALLKTMEEPPEHVKFILCTTEPHKVPATIQSRCQRFDFRPLATSKIAEHLQAILDQERIEAEAEVIAGIARLGRGSMRDALSLLDRLLAAGEERLTSELMEQMLGIPDQSLVVSLVDAIAAGEPDAGLRRASELLAGGTTVDQALELLTEHLRTLMVMAACGPDTDLLELSADARQVAQNQVDAFDAAGLVYMIATCDSIARDARGSSTARALFEAAVVRLCLSHRIADVASLLHADGPTTASTPPKKEDRRELSPPPAAEAPASTPPPVVPPARRPPPSPPKPDANAPSGSAGAVVSHEHETAAVPDERLWPAVLEFAMRSHVDHAMVEGLRLVDFDGSTLRLSVAETGADYAKFLAGQLPRLTELVKRATGRRVRIDLEAPSRSAHSTPAVASESLAEARALPAVRQAVELFDAEVFDVQELRDGEPTGKEE